MKKNLLNCGIFVLIIAVLYITAYFVFTMPINSGTFSKDEYYKELNNPEFKTDKVYEKITDMASAAKVGKKAIADRFENSESKLFSWKGCEVKYNDTDDIWCVRIFTFLGFGGGYSVLFNSNGSVLAIWGEK